MDTRPFHSLLLTPLRNGLTKPTAIRGEGVKMVNMGEVFAHGRISGDIPMDRVPFSEAEKEYLLRPGDLLFARQSLVLSGAGKCSIINGIEEATTFEGHLIRARLNTGDADPLFYYYYFSSLPGRRNIETIVEQVSAAGIRSTDLARLTVPYCPPQLQRTMGTILGALDDKIEHNRQLNATLEKLARNLFRSWFVRFEPVRAKIERRFPTGLTPEIAALFPDRLQESPLGPLPEGWRVSTIGAEVRVVGGSTPSTKERLFWDGGSICWATPKDLASLQSAVLLATERHITERGLSQISSGLLPSGTVLLSSRAPVGYLAIAEVSVAINQGMIAMVCDQELTNHFVLRWAEVNMPTIEAQGNGTTFMEVSKASFRPIKVIVPPRPLINEFTTQAQVIHSMIVRNLRESETLIALRDFVLPELISGKIRLRDVGDLADDML